MGDESGEKTEEPTHKKLEDAREKGQVWKSQDLTSVVVFLVGLGSLKATWDLYESNFKKLFQFAFERMSQPETLETSIFQLMLMAVVTLILLTLPVALAAAVVGGMTEFLQVGALFSIDSVTPNLDKINPIDGLKNLISVKSLVELAKSLAKIGVTSYVVYGVVRDALPMIVSSVRVDANGVLQILGELVYRVVVRVGILFLVFAVFDVWWQHRTYMKDMMMTKDEVKREYKESEGDPHHKAKRKEFHMEILEGAQMNAVRKADVVVTNPDHVAVALQYRHGTDQAPSVLAKATDDQAQALKVVAKAHGVAILRNVPLAHALLAVDVGSEIPFELYDGVAEVLSFVDGLKAASPKTG